MNFTHRDHQRPPSSGRFSFRRVLAAIAFALLSITVRTQAADTYSDNLKVLLIEPGSRVGTWATDLNTKSLNFLDDGVAGFSNIDIASATTYSLAALGNGTDSESRAMRLRFFGTPASAVTITVPASVTSKAYLVENATGKRLTIKYAATAGPTLPHGARSWVWCDGTNVLPNLTRDLPTAAEIAAGLTLANLVVGYELGDVLRYGADLTGVADSATAIQDAVDVAENGGTRNVHIPGGNYLLASPVAPVSELFGLCFLGDGPQTTTLTASHSSGPVLRINRSNSCVKKLTLDATSARTNGAAGSNYGLLVEAPDTINKAVAHYRIDQVIIKNQPNTGYLVSGPSTNGLVTQLQTQSNKGHGSVFDTGIITGRTNKGAVGQVEIIDLWSFSNGGNGLVIGNPSDTTAAGVPYRFVISNLELVGNATDAAVRLSFHEAWVHSENTKLITPAFNCATTHGGMRFSGRDLQVDNPRLVDCTSSASFGADPVAGQFTQRILISNFRALNTAQNPAFVVEDLTNVSNIRVQTASPGNITSWFTAGAVQATVNLTEPVVIKIKTSDETVNNVGAVQDDDALFIPLAASESLAFEAFIRYNGDTTADIKVAFTAPSGATIRLAPAGSIYVSTADAASVSNSETSEGGELAFGSAASSGTRHLLLTGRVVMSTTAGNFRLRWSQNTATVANTSVLAQSTLKVIRGNSLP